MNKQDWIYVIIVTVVISVIVSLVSIKMANTDASLSPSPRTGITSYTKADIDAMLGDVYSKSEVYSKISTDALIDFKVATLAGKSCAGYANLNEGAAGNMILSGNSYGYSVTSILGSPKRVTLNINGINTPQLFEGSIYNLSDSSVLKIKSISVGAGAGTISSVKFTLDAC
jgi:hypothetical protein